MHSHNPNDIPTFFLCVRFVDVQREMCCLAVKCEGEVQYSGLFTCTSLLRKNMECVIDVFDAAPVPFGLVRYGVAPDHQEVSF